MPRLKIIPAALAAALGLFAQTAAPKIEFEKYTLPNGLQVILHVDRKLPMVHVNQWFHVGSANERAGRSGFAHLFEHMMFQGSKNADKYISVVETMGANVFEGAVNGTTDYDRTNYFATVPSGALERLLWLESDRLATLTEGIDQKKLDNQRDVVKNERRQGLENQPYGRAYTLISENLYPVRHPYANDVIGKHEDLTAASMDDVKDFFRTYYTPNNLSLVIAGDFDAAQAKALVAKYFGSIPPGPALDRPLKYIPKLDGTRTLDAMDRVAQERIYIAWPTPAFFDEGDADLDFVGMMFTDGLNARLNRALIYDRQLCSDASASQYSRPLGGMFTVQATARPGVSLAEVQNVIDAEISRFAKTPPTAEELARAKAKFEYQFISGLERIGGFGGKSDRLNQYNTFLGDPGKFDADLERHRAVTVESARKAAAQYLDTPNRLIVRFHPEKSERPVESAKLDRSKQPGQGAERQYQPPEVRSAKLDNGLEIFVVEKRELPKVSITLATRAGAVRDPAEKGGIAQLTASCAQYGTATRKALAIEDALGDLGTAISGNAGTEGAYLNMEVLKTSLGAAMNIFADVARNPVFPESEIARQKQLQHDNLEQEDKDAGALARRIIPGLAFGLDHPYGRPASGSVKSIERITREDLAQFHQKYWKPGSSALIFAGDLSLGEAVEMARAKFGDWTGGAAPALPIPPPKPAPSSRVYVVDRTDAAQTVVGLVLPAPRRSAEDYYAFHLADAAYGGSFKSRLNMNLREEKGYSYGVFSFSQFRREGGTWLASGGVQTDKTKESLVEFRKELLGIAGDKPLTEAELADAKAYRIRSYAQQFESLGRVAGQVGQFWVLGLPMTELRREPVELEKATLAAVNGAAKKYARPDGSILLLVGDWSKIQEGVKSLDLGPAVLLDEEGRARQ